jgi:hypothetical protein
MSDNIPAEHEPEQARPVWKKAVLVVGGVVVGVAGATIVTLAATHKSAVTENAIAYVNGLIDGYSKGFVDGWTEGVVDGLEMAFY